MAVPIGLLMCILTVQSGFNAEQSMKESILGGFTPTLSAKNITKVIIQSRVSNASVLSEIQQRSGEINLENEYE